MAWTTPILVEICIGLEINGDLRPVLIRNRFLHDPREELAGYRGQVLGRARGLRSSRRARLAARVVAGAGFA